MKHINTDTIAYDIINDEYKRDKYKEYFIDLKEDIEDLYNKPLCGTCKIELCKKLFNYKDYDKKLRRIYNDVISVNSNMLLDKRQFVYDEVEVKQFDEWLVSITEDKKIIKIDITLHGNYYKIIYMFKRKVSFKDTIIEKISLDDKNIQLWVNENQEELKLKQVDVFFVVPVEEQLFMYILKEK